MFVSEVLSELHVEVQEDIPNLVPLDFLHLKTAHMYHNNEHLIHSYIDTN